MPLNLAGGLPPTGLGGVEVSKLAPSVRLPQFAGGDWMDRFGYENELAYAITPVCLHVAKELPRLALWHATAPMLMVSNPSRGDARAAVGNVNSNVSGLERAAKRCRPLAADASLAAH
jgi:hypothetical protein